MVEIIATPVRNNYWNSNVQLRFTFGQLIGSGSFGAVYQGVLSDGQIVAIKKMNQDKRIPNRELEIIRQLDHPNVVRLNYYFYSAAFGENDIFLHLVMEYVPTTVHRLIKSYRKIGRKVPMIFTKLFMYQLFRALDYIHTNGICHRDIKPANLLCDPNTGTLKLCDFGSAKIMNRHRNEISVFYICSRYYRAPELLLCNGDYSTSIDIWSSGCILGEMLKDPYCSSASMKPISLWRL